mmetsp:Transcript_23535/g.41569  ORF Transcript_23535/g.41569 Transcript_23535/m.41569 type:complete len:270 (-) Transcript_23535:762-1571(-)
MTDIQTTYLFISMFLGVSATVKAFEVAALGEALEEGGALYWPVVGAEWLKATPLNGMLGQMYRRNGMFFLGALALLCTASIITVFFQSQDVTTLRVIAVVLFGCHVALYYRQDLGTDGADQMSFIISCTVLLCFAFSTNETIHLIGILFIAAQLCIAYLASGISKLFSKSWRSGEAASGVLSTVTYGNSLTRAHIKNHKTLALLICWATILWESLFPAIFFFDGTLFLIGIACAGLFHVMVATIMGLNAFIWAFGAAYPAVIYVGFHVL